ncbi:MAG: AlpA family transcriptional regulator [Magnetococcales bacterium]|nr:AlpA family transcriptional regulator [Magnetococcales bacterium]
MKFLNQKKREEEITISTVSRILRLNEVISMTGLSRSTIYRLVSKGEMPQRFKLGPKSVGWKFEQIIAWINSRPIAA